MFTPDPTKFGIKTVHGDKVEDVMGAPGDDWDEIAHQVETSFTTTSLNTSADSHLSRGSGSRGSRNSRRGLEGPSILRRPGTTKSQVARMASTQKKLHPGSDLPGHKLKQFSPERVKSKLFEPSLRQREAAAHEHAHEQRSKSRAGGSTRNASVKSSNQDRNSRRCNTSSSQARSISSWHVVAPSDYDNHGARSGGGGSRSGEGVIPIDDAPWSPEPNNRNEQQQPPFTGRSDAPSFAGFSEISHETLRETDFDGNNRNSNHNSNIKSNKNNDNTQRSRAPDAPGHTGRGQPKQRPGSRTSIGSSSRGGDLDTTAETFVPDLRIDDPHMVSHRKREARPARR